VEVRKIIENSKMATGETSIKVVTFSGKKSDWVFWKDRYMARARKKGWQALLKGQENVPTARQETNGLNADQRAIKERNEDAFADLLLSMDVSKPTGKTCHRIIKTAASTTDYPNGNVTKAWEKLEKKFAPSNAPTRMELNRQFHAAEMRKHQDPDTFIDYLDELRTRMDNAGDSIPEDKFIMHVLNKLPPEYEQQVVNLEERLESQNLDMDKVRTDLQVKYQRLQARRKKRQGMDDDDESEDYEEKALAAYSKPFKGRCHRCGKIGHKARDHKDGNNNNDNGNDNGGSGRGNRNRNYFPGKCNVCGKWGHKAKDCYRRNNRHRNEGDEQANHAADEPEQSDDESSYHSEELVMMAMDTPALENYYSVDSSDEGSYSIENCSENSSSDEESAEGSYIDFDPVEDNIPNDFFDDFGGEETPEEEIADIVDDVPSDFMLETSDSEGRKEKELLNSPLAEMSLRTIARSRNDFSANTWIGDTGASTYMGPSEDGMVNVRELKHPVSLGNGKDLMATKVGDKNIAILQEDGNVVEILLKDYMVVPNLKTHLFSLTKPLSMGWSLHNEGMNLVLSKGNTSIKFDKRCRTSRGVVCGVDVCSTESANPAIERGHCDINEFHHIIGHPSEDTTRRTANYYGVQLTGKFEVCEDCKMGNARQKNVPKTTERQSERAGELLYIDISSVKHRSYGGSKFWLLVIDDYTDRAWSFFLRRKSHQVKHVLSLITDLKAKHGVRVERIRCDNAGENKLLETVSRKQGYGLEFEYTPPGSPQFNGKVERKFATIVSRVRAQNTAAGFERQLRNGLWTESARHATDLENLMLTKRRSRSPHYDFFNCDAGYFKCLRQFGEVAICKKLSKQRQGKIEERGRRAIYLGRANDHAVDVHRFLALDTKRIIMSRDITWLNKVYGEWKRGPKWKQEVVTHPTTNDDDDTDDELIEPQVGNGDAEPEAHDEQEEDGTNDQSDEQSENSEDSSDQDQEEEPQQEPTHHYNTRARGISHPNLETPARENPRVQREVRNLSNFLNPIAQDLAAETSAVPTADTATDQSGRDVDVANTMIDRWHPDYAFSSAVPDFALSVTDDESKAIENKDWDNVSPSRYKDIFTNPKNFQEAWHHPDPWQRKRWREAIRKEFAKMNRLQVWRKVPRTAMPAGRRCVKYKWVLEIKRNGVFRARLVACGYSQIPGVDFTEVYAPVLTDVAFRILITLCIYNGYDAMIMDIETAFLHGELEEEIYMECPEGMEDAKPGEVLRLIKTIYGLVQSSRAYYKKFVKVARSIGLIPSQADPCVFVRKSDAGIVYVGMYV
jgi:transposase InsO family protein